jgi:hypothetical protein
MASPPTIEELIVRLRSIMKITVMLPPEFQSVHRQIAELYEMLRAAQEQLRNH